MERQPKSDKRQPLKGIILKLKTRLGVKQQEERY